FNFGVPCYRPWGCPYPYYYRPYPVYVAPPPVVFAPAPVVVQPAPVVVPAPPVIRSQAPVPEVVTASSPVTDARQLSGEKQLQRLQDGDEGARADAAIQLGRLKADSAVDALITCLAKDSSPAVRETAARALGLIAAPRSVSALARAGQVDSDRDVR